MGHHDTYSRRMRKNKAQTCSNKDNFYYLVSKPYQYLIYSCQLKKTLKFVMRYVSQKSMHTNEIAHLTSTIPLPHRVRYWQKDVNILKWKFARSEIANLVLEPDRTDHVQIWPEDEEGDSNKDQNTESPTNNTRYKGYHIEFLDWTNIHMQRGSWCLLNPRIARGQIVVCFLLNFRLAWQQQNLRDWKEWPVSQFYIPFNLQMQREELLNSWPLGQGGHPPVEPTFNWPALITDHHKIYMVCGEKW